MATEDILSTDDIESLVRQLRDDEAERVDDVGSAARWRFPAVRDIRRPERGVLRQRFAAAAKSMEDAMAAELACAVRVELVEEVQVSRRAFRDATEDLVTTTLASPAATGLLAVEPALALAIVDRTLGGSATDVPDRKSLTPVEKLLLEGVLRRAVEGLFDDKAFAPAGRFRVAAKEVAPASAAAVADSDARAIGVQFLFSVGGSLPSGEIRVFVPEPPLREAVGITSPSGAPGSEEKRRLNAFVQRLSIPISIVLGRARCGVQEIAALEPGDVIALDAPRDAPVVVRVGEKPRLTARLGRKDGQFAVKIGRWLGAKPAPPPPGAAPGPPPPPARPAAPPPPPPATASTTPPKRTS